jgi:2-polyprenyl-3-methyl-5-hydroxy-6-metoxy-1,4-benzoquinol methylase
LNIKSLKRFVGANPWARQLATSSAVRMSLMALEYIVFGGDVRRRFTRKLLNAQFRSKFRRDWLWSSEKPHSSDHEMLEMSFVPPVGANAIYRGILVAELLADGDHLLDIGCGDGFFDCCFYALKCDMIDAVDVDPAAINSANNRNAAPNIRYYLQDAINQPFPSSKYDIVVWDGAIGHFSADSTVGMLDKIAAHLKENGIFCGSESLGHEEGHDHLQFFETIHDMAGMLKRHFKYVQVRENRYGISDTSDFIRREVYWRCSNSSERLDKAQWTSS